MVNENDALKTTPTLYISTLLNQILWKPFKIVIKVRRIKKKILPEFMI
jgi:hypothetical protein